ncbi:MAG: hypothetical protein ACTMIR_09290 [Cellulomonadaceae bacterium]
MIRRSEDGGRTWTEPVDGEHGLISAAQRFHTAPVPLVEHGGRLWRAVETLTNDDDSWGHFAAAVMHADAGADLLRAESWTITPSLAVPAELREQGVGSWLEGNTVITAAGGLANLLRTNGADRSRQVAALGELDADGLPAGSPHLGALPGAESKFTVRHDAQLGLYVSLVNTALYDASPHLQVTARNTLSLVTSPDLREWSVVHVVLHHPDDERHGFQYVDWRVDGPDVVAAVRVAARFRGAPAKSFHDSNLVTVVRIPDFRDLITRTLEG